MDTEAGRECRYGKTLWCRRLSQATQFGVLTEDNRAVDTAVAVSAALNVTEPGWCGIGGFVGDLGYK